MFTVIICTLLYLAFVALGAGGLTVVATAVAAWITSDAE